MKTVVITLLCVHGLIHLLGTAHAFRSGGIKQFRKPLSKTTGSFWLISSLLFLFAAILYISNHAYWWLAAGVAVLLSQFLILKSWRDAKAGSVLNVLLIISVVIGAATWKFHSAFVADAKLQVQQTNQSDSLLTENVIRNLPLSVQKYIRYTGALNQPKVQSFKVQFTGRIRDYEKKEWMNFESVQYNFQEPATRLFFMNATMMHLPVASYHRFINGSAFMDIRLLSLLTVQYQSGREMNIAETVTFFNDMCVMAPATLIDPRITWTEIDSLHTDATFSNNGITIKASLLFNEKGELINFISNDRYALVGEQMQQLQWSTPMSNYKEVNGRKLANTAQAVYLYPSGEFAYGEFSLVNIVYNPSGLEE